MPPEPAFFLGHPCDPRTGKLAADEFNLPADYLTTHAVCVGMTGSGTTGLGVDLLEEAALAGIPALVIDPKGDMTNLARAFPDLADAGFAPWVPPIDVPARLATELVSPRGSA